MRLHRISTLNLNSLYGAQSLDLDEQLKGASLFLIHGKTGAGKSTLMDAIALALFGRTPRLEGRTGDPDSDPPLIMSRGTGECLAEVEFSKLGEKGQREHFRATWMVWRARKRADGKLQGVERSLERRTPLGEWTMLVSGRKKGDVESAFDTVLEGFSAEDFQRSMLLAQGRFDELLTASEAERASLLERLTDTHCYAEIGAHSAELASAHRRNVEHFKRQIASQVPIQPEAEQQIQAKLLAADRARAEAAAKQRRAEVGLVWFQGRHRLLGELGELTHAGQMLENKELEFLALGQRLTEHERCALAFPLLQTSLELGEEVASRSLEQETLGKARDLQCNTVASLRSALAETSSAKQAQEQLVSKLSVPCAELASAKSAAQAERDQRDKLLGKSELLQREALGVTEKLLCLEKEEALQQSDLALLDHWLNGHSQLGKLSELWVTGLQRESASLLTELTHLKSRSKEVLERREKLKIRKINLKTATEAFAVRESTTTRGPETSLAASAAALQSLCGVLSASDYAASVELQIDRVTANVQAALEAKGIAFQVERARQSVAACELKREATEQLLVAQTTRLTAIEHTRIIKESVMLAARRAFSRLALVVEMTERRKLLVDGQECPLCGSTSHPYSDQPELCPPDAAVQQLVSESQKESLNSEQAYQLVDAEFQSINNSISVLKERQATQAEQLRGEQETQLELERTLQLATAATQLFFEEPLFFDEQRLPVESSEHPSPRSQITRSSLLLHIEKQEQRLTSLRAQRTQLIEVQEKLKHDERALESFRANLAQEQEKLKIESGLLLAELELLDTDTAAQDEQHRGAQLRVQAMWSALHQFDSVLLDSDSSPLSSSGAEGDLRESLQGWVERVESTLQFFESQRAKSEKARANQHAATLQKMSAQKENSQVQSRLADLRVELAEQEQAFQIKLRAAKSLWQQVCDLYLAGQIPSEEQKGVKLPENSKVLLALVHEELAHREAQLSKVRNELERAQTELAGFEGRLGALAETLALLQTRRKKCENELNAKLLQLGNLNIDDLKERRLAAGLFEQAIQQRRNLVEARQRHQVRLEERELALNQHQGQMPSALGPLETLSLAQFVGELDEQTLALQLCQQNYEEAKQAVSALEAQRKTSKKLLQDWGNAQKEAEVWLQLNELIGIGKGEAFRKFAQSLNLHRLINKANVHLARLSERYRLVQSRRDQIPTLEFAIEDLWSVGAPRSTRSLSGGERFLVSLALALGLSDLRSHRLPIETLLLDEGFGTLDPETLELALSALVRLQSDGRVVGVISHVGALKERIAAQVHIKELSPGRSVISVPSRF